jgi:hypothetical protein
MVLDRYLSALTMALAVAGCGGGAQESEATTPAALRIAPQATAATSTVTPQEAARQLMDLGEASYPQFFPGHKTTSAASPFVYRYYPETGIYLGVVVSAGSPYELNGVYVMGGAFGSSPQFVGPLSAFITPTAATQSLTFVTPAVQTSPNQTFGVISEPTIQPYVEPGVPAPLGPGFAIDLQGNGRPDVVACHAAYPPGPNVKVPCRVLRPQTDGSVVDVTRQLLGAGALPNLTHPREMVWGDFNHDGRPDIFVAAHGYDALPFAGETNVLLISNSDGTYTDRSSTLPQASDFSHSACVGDVGGDGNPDIYVGNFGGQVTPYFLMGNGDGTFTKRTTGLPPEVIGPVEERGHYLSCLLVDIDQDGHLDLVLGTGGTPGHLDNIILFNDGTAGFGGRPIYRLPQGPLRGVLDIATLDVNRDGRPDLLVLFQEDTTTGHGFGLQVLVNQGDGTLADETTSRLPGFVSRPDGPWPAFINLVDLNGDGWEDIYFPMGQDGDNYLRVWLNNGNGTWAPVEPSSLPAQSNSAALIVDFDGDGRPDLLRLGWGGLGADIGYKSWLNRTPRAVPSQPLIGTVIAGSTQATLSFKTPLGSGPSPITGYTATCSAGTLSSVGTATASPIVVSGLVNGKSYSCSVRASSAAGSSLPSAMVTVRPQQ